MKRRVKKLWFKALTSGEFTIRRHRLRKRNSFDPLGVLCELFRQETGRGQWLTRRKAIFEVDGQARNSTLPAAVQEWAGIKGFMLGPEIVYKGKKQSITALHDHGVRLRKLVKAMKEQL